MVVLVKGTALSPPEGSVTRVADTIIYEETVEGVVQSVDPDGSSLIILGQFVVVNQKTVIDESIPGRSIRNLKPGLDRHTSERPGRGRRPHFGYLGYETHRHPHYEVQGIIKNHDARGKRFEIGQLIVDYSSADVSDIAAGGTMNWNDRLVHVRGDEWQPRSEVPYGATLRATRVNGLGLMVEDSAEANIEGFITYMTQSGAFTINNHPVKCRPPQRSRMARRTSLSSARMCSSMGHWWTECWMLRSHLQRKPSDGVERRVDRPSSPYSNPSRSVWISIESDAQTLIEHGGTVIRFEDIRIGDHLKIHANLLDGQRTLATELERTEPSAVIVLEAPLQSAVDPQILIAGVSIDTSGLSENEFVGNYGPIGRSTFFENALIGRPVWGKGTLTGNSVAWSSVGIRR